MTVREVVDRILAYHPDLGPDYKGCDNYKAGNPDQECTGIVCAMTATIEVIRKAIEQKANLILVHEPTFYTSADDAGWFEEFDNAVYNEKQALLDDNGIVIWRDHDHMHAHQPDGIFTGVLKYMGWLDYLTMDTSMGAFAHFIVDLPEVTTLEQLMHDLVTTIGIQGTRYMGDPGMAVKKIALVGHLFPGLKTSDKYTGQPGTPTYEYATNMARYYEQEHVDVLIPGEVIDWTLLSYIRDANQLGHKAGMINLGHYNWEELGMRYTKEWLAELVGGELSVSYVPSGNLYDFYLSGGSQSPH